MSGVYYVAARTAAWAAVVVGSRVLVFAPHDQQRLAEFEASMRSGAVTQVVLDALTKGGISSTPDFALVDLPGESATPADLALIVRGGIEVTVHTAAGVEQVSGARVSTWVERTVSDATGVRIVTGAPSLKAGSHELALSVVDGTVLVSSIWAGRTEQTPGQAPEQIPEQAREEQEQIGQPVVADDRPPKPELASAPVEMPVATDDSEYEDLLFGETRARTVEGAAVRGPSATEPGTPTAGDHDGRTSLGLSAEARRAARQARAEAKPSQRSGPRYRLEFASGQVEELDRTIIIGRAPRVDKVPGDSMPKLVPVDGPEHDISRNHVQFSVEGDTVVVTDLHSRNGTTIQLPGSTVQRLRAGDQTPVLTGTIVDLGSGVVITVQEH